MDNELIIKDMNFLILDFIKKSILNLTIKHQISLLYNICLFAYINTLCFLSLN